MRCILHLDDIDFEMTSMWKNPHESGCGQDFRRMDFNHFYIEIDLKIYIEGMEMRLY